MTFHSQHVPYFATLIGVEFKVQPESKHFSSFIFIS